MYFIFKQPNKFKTFFDLFFFISIVLTLIVQSGDKING